MPLVRSKNGTNSRSSAVSLSSAKAVSFSGVSFTVNSSVPMRRIGALEFTLKDTPLKLTAFAEEADTQLLRLFVPFFDRTNGTETYPGGRYLDLDRTATGIYDLDFNRAYSPYCHFNPKYDCPVPPRENRLAVPVRAGEKLESTK